MHTCCLPTQHVWAYSSAAAEGREKVAEAPYCVRVVPGAASLKHCCLHLPPADQVLAGQLCSFTVALCDCHGNRCCWLPLCWDLHVLWRRLGCQAAGSLELCLSDQQEDMRGGKPPAAFAVEGLFWRISTPFSRVPSSFSSCLTPDLGHAV